MTDYTRPPWKVDASEARYGDDGLYMGGMFIMDEDDETAIAELCGAMPPGETLANAALLAAAPDLLECCRNAESYIETPSDLTEEEMGYLLDDIRYAIAKATPKENHP